MSFIYIYSKNIKYAKHKTPYCTRYLCTSREGCLIDLDFLSNHLKYKLQNSQVHIHKSECICKHLFYTDEISIQSYISEEAPASSPSCATKTSVTPILVVLVISTTVPSLINPTAYPNFYIYPA